MKRRIVILLLLLIGISVASMAQQSVAVMDVKVLEGTVSVMNKAQIRGALEKGITQSPGYKAYNRTNLDRMAKELAFQRTGEVSDEQIRELGRKAGVDYILVSEVAKSGNDMYVNVSILNIETGEYDKSDNILIVKATNENIQTKCVELTQSMFGSIATTSGNNSNYSKNNNNRNNYNENSSNNTNSNRNNYSNNNSNNNNTNSNSNSRNNNNNSKPVVPAGYTDLGLPSGTKWKNNNESDFYTYDDAVRTFGNKLPTKEQLEELEKSCQWKWTGSGYKVTGPNGNSITLPAAGVRNCYGDTYYVGSDGYYWSSTPSGSGTAWRLYFYSGSVYMDSYYRCDGGSVRLVQ